MKKRILALATVVLMIFTVPLYSFAEDGTPADGESAQTMQAAAELQKLLADLKQAIPGKEV